MSCYLGPGVILKVGLSFSGLPCFMFSSGSENGSHSFARVLL